MSRRVKDGVLQYVSASAIKTYSSCPRRWYLEAVVGLKSPESKAQKVGKEIHKQIELYYEHGAMPKHPSAYKAVTEVLPARGANLLIEQPMGQVSVDHAPEERKFEGDPGPSLSIAGIPVVGFIDLIDPSADDHEIIDHKSTSDMARAKTPDDLRTDPQMIIYARWALEMFGDNAVTVSHCNIATKKTDARLISSRVGIDEIKATWDNLATVVEDMKSTALATSYEAIPKPPTKVPCVEYRGCPWQKRCYPNPIERVAMNLSDKLKKNEAPVGAVGVLPPDAAPPVKSSELVTEEKPKRGRKAKTEPVDGSAGYLHQEVAAPLSSSNVETVVIPQPTVEQFQEVLNKLQAKVDRELDSLVLYIDCVPVKGAVGSRLEDVIAARAQEIAKAQGVDDIRFIEYGGWKGFLANSLRNDPPKGVYHVSSGDLANVAIEALTPLASLVVRGVR